MSRRLSALIIGVLSLLTTSAAAEKCGDAFYDPSIYVCHFGQFLCPVVNGEGYSYCNGACYSRFMYTCRDSALSLLSQIDPGTTFSLRVSNPAAPAVHDKPITACGRHWGIGGATCSYCPDVVKPSCPPGLNTSMVYSGAMNTMVPGGQQYYLDPDWLVGYTQAHSVAMPPGSIVGGLVAYQGGGFINMNPTASGWFACPPRASGGGGDAWTLVGRNATNGDKVMHCTGVNLVVNLLPSGPAVWQYT